MKNLFRCVLALVLMGACSNGVLFASFTFVANTPHAGEVTLYEGAVGYTSGATIMSTLYGLGNYTRISDNLDNVLLNSTVGTVATVEAKYAGNSQKLSYVGANNGTTVLFNNVTGNGYLNLGPVALPSTNLPENFRFLLQSPSGSGPTFSSDRFLNASNFDHMVTFQLTGGRFVFAFEDTTGGGDKDYNDLVVELTFSGGSNPIIPEPATVGLFGIGAFLFGASRLPRKQS